MIKTKTNKILGFALIVLVITILISTFASAAIIVDQGDSVSDSLSLTLDRTSCENNNDLLVEVPYLSCTPQIIRSDLLEEQDVDVYCPLFASSLNPFLTVGSFEDVDFSGSYDSNIRGIGFVKDSSYSSKGIFLSSPEDAQRIGYATIRIKKQSNESMMPEFVEANLSARIYYTPEHSQNYQAQQFILRKLNDYESGLKENSFWEDNVNIELESVTATKARVILNDASLKEIANIELSSGQVSQEIEIPGVGVCDASMVVKLDSISLPETYARLIIDGKVVEVTKGSRILNGVCTVNEIAKQGLFETISISCGRNNLIQLTNNPKVRLKITKTDSSGNTIGSPIEGDYKVGDLLQEGVLSGSSNRYNLFLGYIGKDYKGDLIIVPFLSTAKDSEEFLKSAYVLRSSLNYINALDKPENTVIDLIQLGGVVKNIVWDSFKKATPTLIDVVNNAFNLNIPNQISLHAPLAIYVLTPEGTSLAGKDTEFYSKLKTTDKSVIPKIEIVSLAGPLNSYLGNSESYYLSAKEQYEKVIKEYSEEKDFDNQGRTIAEAAYLDLMGLASELKQSEDLKTLCEEVKMNYPEAYTKDSEFLGYCNSLETFSNSESNVAYVELRGEVYSLILKEIYEPGKNDYGAEIRLYSSEGALEDKLIGKDEKSFFPSSEKDYVVLKSIDETKAYLEVYVTNSRDNKITKSTVNLNLGETYSVPNSGYQIKLNKINLRRNARVSVIPNFNEDYSDVKFNIKIGIEKRAVKLAPEKTLEAIKKANESISKLNKTSESLGKVVSGLNKACTAAQTVFTIKNFFAGLSGEGLARQKVMRGAGGWTERCTQEFSKENSEYLSVEDCFLKNSDEIDNQVKGLTSEMDKINQEIQTIKTSLASVDSTKQSEEFIERYCAEVSKNIPPDEKLNSLRNMINSTNCVTNWKAGKFTEEDLTEIRLYAGVVSSSQDSFNLKNLAQSKLISLEGLTNIVQASTETTQEKYTVRIWKDSLSEYNEVRVYDGDTVLGSNIIGASSLDSSKKYPVAVILYKNTYYLLILQEIVGYPGSYHIAGDPGNKQVYSVKDSALPKPGQPITVEPVSPVIENEILKLVLKFETYNSESYKNTYKNPELKYYETEPYKGMPAVVPFNKTHGWYAAMKQTLPIGSAITPMDESGKRVNSFYLCNVGKNGIEEFSLEGFGDDICALMNLNTGQPYNQFAGLTTSEAATLVDKAVNAIQQAQSAYKPGLKQAVVLGQTFNVGAPAVNTPSVQCQDVMSPKECNIMFNLCDPVACPSSRCDFGGKYPVSDVVQTGIIGSIALCLPNAKEGIAIPVCLTGVQAGVDGLISVQKSYRDCLQENLDTGKTVGICDEIMSIYYCEFLFEQAGPLLLELGTSGILSALESGSGGGEYLYASDAVGNAKRSYQYFTQTYSTESQSVFSSQTMQGLTEGICKTFISTVYPSTAEGIENVQQTTEQVNSPPQYHARFDEIVLTTATVPATSQYKVFYHIFAGKEEGVYYRVYLKGGDELSYYQDTNKVRLVASGFVEKGGYASETKDFSAPSGYKQLCISINGQEECGFQQVSTSLAVDYLTDKYLAEQASSTDIRTEAECVSGKLNWGALLNLNAQSAASELIDPAIYNKGITRMCATNNPGIGTDSKAETSESRWVSVGYCDDPAMKCWLDTQEVKEILDSPDLAKFISNGETETLSEGVLENVEDSYLEFLKSEGKYLSQDKTQDLIEYLGSNKWASGDSSGDFSLGGITLKIEELIGVKITFTSLYDARLRLIDEVFKKAIFTNDKAKLILLKARVYAELARNAIVSSGSTGVSSGANSGDLVLTDQ